MATIPMLGLIATLNLLAGGLVALLVMKAQETLPQIAPVPGVVFGGFAIWAQLTVGDRLDPTIPELEALVLTAVVAALIGLVGTFSALEPEAH